MTTVYISNPFKDDIHIDEASGLNLINPVTDKYIMDIKLTIRQDKVSNIIPVLYQDSNSFGWVPNPGL